MLYKRSKRTFKQQPRVLVKYCNNLSKIDSEQHTAITKRFATILNILIFFLVFKQILYKSKHQVFFYFMKKFLYQRPN